MNEKGIILQRIIDLTKAGELQWISGDKARWDDMAIWIMGENYVFMNLRNGNQSSKAVCLGSAYHGNYELVLELLSAVRAQFSLTGLGEEEILRRAQDILMQINS